MRVVEKPAEYEAMQFTGGNFTDLADWLRLGYQVREASLTPNNLLRIRDYEDRIVMIPEGCWVIAGRTQSWSVEYYSPERFQQDFQIPSSTPITTVQNFFVSPRDAILDGPANIEEQVAADEAFLRGCNEADDAMVDRTVQFVREIVNEADSCEEPTFESELQELINRWSKENGSDTPDFILADFLEASLNAFDDAVRCRAIWYGVSADGPFGSPSTNSEGLALTSQDDTVQKVYAALLRSGIHKLKAIEAIGAMQNAGIFFRERPTHG